MNLFISSKCPRESARWLDDKRVGKALMECNQMLSLAVKHHDPFGEWIEGPGSVCCGMAYLNHPVSIWVRSNRARFDWAVEHGRELTRVFWSVYGRTHASAARTEYLAQFSSCIPEGELEPFQNSARNGDFDFTHLPIPHSYRVYMQRRWVNDKRAVTFTDRERPNWLVEAP